jgi:hypothetical protein
MKYRSKINYKKGKRMFSKTADRTHYKNTQYVNPVMMRGGTRL